MKKEKRVSQKEKIINQMRSAGSITALEALGTMGCFRLQARINELRNAGWDILTTMKKDVTGKSYARYSLV